VAAIVLVVGAAPASAAVPRIKPRAVRVVEGTGATKTVRIPVTLSAKARATVTARFRTVLGTAGAADFTARSGKVRVRRGARRATVRLRIAGDAVDEPNERFKLRLSSPRRARLGKPRAAKITIVDDDPAVVALADASLTEPPGAGDVASHGLTLRLGAPAAEEVRVDFELVAGTATAADADLPRGTVTIPAGQTQSVLPGVVRGDGLDEAAETIAVLLRNPVGARLQSDRATLTIGDDPADLPPSASIGDVSRAEDAAGPALVPVTLSAPSGRAVTIAYSTRDGTADGGDHPAASGTVTLAPGATTASIAAPITDDERDEDTQTFAVRLDGADFATLADAEAAVTITDDDAPPSVSIDDVTRAEGGPIPTFTLTLSGASEKAISLRASTDEGSASDGATCAVAGTDYIPLSNLPVVFSPLVVTRTVNVSICNDVADEPPVETAAVVLSQPVNVTLGDASGTLTIVDDD
jgi:Calx-beta domain